MENRCKVYHILIPTILIDFSMIYTVEYIRERMRKSIKKRFIVVNRIIAYHIRIITFIFDFPTIYNIGYIYNTIGYTHKNMLGLYSYANISLRHSHLCRQFLEFSPPSHFPHTNCITAPVSAY